MNQTPLYYDDTLLTEEDYSLICHDFKIPHNELLSAIDQIQKKGEPAYSLFQSTVRERIRDWFSHVSLTAPEDEVEVLVVNGTQEPIPAPTPTLVALDSPAPPQSPPAPTPKPKKTLLVESSKVKALGNTIAIKNIKTLLEDFPMDEDESTDPTPLAERDEVVESAATALMQAMTSGEGHFIITDDGICTINPESPPTLVHSYQVIQNVIRLGGLGEKVKDKQSWMLGSITSALEDYHGEAFNISQVCEQTEKAENTIRQAVSVFRKFKDKKYNLSYSHHQEAYHIKVPWETTCLILHKAECYELSAKNVRALGSIVKTMDDDQVVRNIRSNAQAHDLIDAYKQAKVKYMCYAEGCWMEISGLDGELPKQSAPDEPEEHFPVVLDLKNKVAYAAGVKQSDIVKRGLRKA